MPSKPLPRMVQVQDMPARDTKGREARGAPDVGVARLLGPVAARQADDFQADDAAREVLLAVRAGDA